MEKDNFKLKAELNQNCLNIILEQDNFFLGKIKTDNDRTLSKKLLPLLDKFLKKNIISVKDIREVELKSELPDSFTSFRIVKVVLDAIYWQNNPVKSRQVGTTGQARSTKIRKSKD